MPARFAAVFALLGQARIESACRGNPFPKWLAERPVRKIEADPPHSFRSERMSNQRPTISRKATRSRPLR